MSSNYYCQATSLGLPVCNHFRRKSWGVCRGCWDAHICDNPEKEEAYHNWWNSQVDSDFKVVLKEASQTVVASSEPPTKKSRGSNDESPQEAQHKDAAELRELGKEIRLMTTNQILKEMTIMVKVLQERQ